MIEIDGSTAGGQVLRTAVTMSILSGETVEISAVRGNRTEPGLKAQHLAAVETAAAVCDASVDGASLGSETVRFDPGEPTGGTYEATVGTAGSLTLVFDTLLPVAVALDEPLSLAATGGTDVAWSPPMAFYREVKLPLLREYGLAAVVEHERTGFYPAGGGRATLRLWPSELSPIDLSSVDRPESNASATEDDVTAAVFSTASTDLADADVAQRQADAVVEGLADQGIETTRRETRHDQTENPGSSLVAHLIADGVRAGFSAYGEPGKPAEEVGGDVVDEVAAFTESGAGVDRHLGDQLLVFLALAGGSVTIARSTDHIESSLAVLDAFGHHLSKDALGERSVVVG